MNKLVILIVCAVWLAAIPVASAQEPTRPPTIFRFESDVTSVTLEQVEAGDMTATLSWHVAHVTDEHRLVLHVYRDYEWVSLNSEPLPPVGSQQVTLEHPQGFGPVTFRLSIVNKAGDVMDERTLIIPYDLAGLAGKTPAVELFSAGSTTIDAATIAAGNLRVQVSWKVANRLPLTNLVFEQVLPGGQARNIELPRATLWVPSSGTGVVAPVQPSDGNVITLRLRVVDVITADVYDEHTVTITIIGTALPPEPDTAEAPTQTAEPSAAGDLMILTDCTFTSTPVRGWVDGPGIPSPDTQHYAYATNPQGDAQLVIARSDGSGQATIDAPDKNFPIGIAPRWSPDSQRIAFANISISQPGGGTIYVVKADGSDLRRVADYVGYYDDLAWSSDSTQIYFTSGETSGAGSGMQVVRYKIYAVVADGLSAPQVVMDGCGVRG